MKQDISVMALSPNGLFLVLIDVTGRGLVVNYPQQVVLCSFKCKHSRPKRVAFSPDSEYFAIGCLKMVQVWQVPNVTEGKRFAPLRLVVDIRAHMDQVTSLCWSSIQDANVYYLLTASKDTTAKILTIRPQKDALAELPLAPVSLVGHRGALLGAFFSSILKPNTTLQTLTKDGALFVWSYADAGWQIIKKHYINGAKISSYCAKKDGSLLVIGQTNGVFTLLDLPDCHTLQTLSVFQNAKISTMSINDSGEWIAFARPGHLCVWEWPSETFVLRQQGHASHIHCLSFAIEEGEGRRLLASGSQDGTVKVWDADAAFSFVHFHDHNGPVHCVELVKQGRILLSGSADGTVRAYDLRRYRCFKMLATPIPTSITTLCADPSGDLVVGASGAAMDGASFDIYVWSLQTGQLLDILTGHQGPIQTLSCDPTRSGLIVSGSLDKSVRVWSLYKGGLDSTLDSLRKGQSRTAAENVIDLGSEVSCAMFRPDGREIAVACLNGQISFFDSLSFQQVHSIDGARDASGGRYSHDLFTAKHSPRSKYFTSLCYSADSSLLIAGGISNHVCIYDMTLSVGNRPLLKQINLSHHLGLEGVQEKLNSRRLKEGRVTSDSEDETMTKEGHLPGTPASKTRAIRCTSIRFSPDGRSWAAATTDGLLLYSLDDTLLFDPLQGLLPEITPESIMQVKKPSLALLMALRLNDTAVTIRVILSIPKEMVSLIVANDVPFLYVERLVHVLGEMLDKVPKTDIFLEWIKQILLVHGLAISKMTSKQQLSNTSRVNLMTGLRAVFQSIQRIYQPLSQM